ncbi:MAG: LuxR family transcriptional regulator, partial [Paracoccaceae bacterium]|nr:LuxR family transcriptional regulator [Paracoccaceae bacterium]
SYGFDRIIYGFTHFSTPKGFGDPDDFILLTNHSSEYVDEFVHEGLFLDAPMTNWAFENEGVCSWRMLENLAKTSSLSVGEMRAIEFNKRHGATCGYTISFNPLSTRSRGAIGLTGRVGLTQDDVDDIWKLYGDELVLINNVAHLKIMSLPYTTMSGRKLTKRQREALEWVADGKTAQQIAMLMGLTAATVEKHLRLARENLGVETTAQAVLKAAFQNQMFIVERES